MGMSRLFEDGVCDANLRKFLHKVFRAQMCVVRQHVQRLVPRDRRDLHHIEVALEKAACRFMTQIVLMRR